MAGLAIRNQVTRGWGGVCPEVMCSKACLSWAKRLGS